jgi:hypothetical protein
MLGQVNREGALYQESAVHKISSKFGHRLIYINENSKFAIHKDVLAAFMKLSGDSVVWERKDCCWRQRRPDDASEEQRTSRPRN